MLVARRQRERGEKEYAAFPFLSTNPVSKGKRLSLLGHYQPLCTSAAEINNTKWGGIKYQDKNKKTNSISIHHPEVQWLFAPGSAAAELVPTILRRDVERRSS